MGKTITPKYAVDIYENRIKDGMWQSVRATDCTTWDGKRHGTPTAKKVEDYALVYGKSLEAGGVNAHISKGLGFIPYPTRVVVRENRPNGRVVAEWKSGPFQVW